MQITIIQWIKMPCDKGHRFIASGIAGAKVTVPKGVSARRMAVDLDENGEDSRYAGLYPARKPGETLARFFGVTVKFESGRTKTYRYWQETRP